MLIYGLVIFINRSLYLMVSLLSQNFSMISVAACIFFCLINPMVVLLTIAGVALYIMHFLNGFICGNPVDSWLLVVCLALALANSILAVFQSVRIFKSMVNFR